MAEVKGLIRNIEIPIYRIVINVLIHEDCTQALALSENLENVPHEWGDWENTYGAYLYLKEDNIHAIVLSEDVDVETISHECFHAVMTTLQLKGIRYSQKSEEAFAYVLGYLTKEVFKAKEDYDNGHNE